MRKLTTADEIRRNHFRNFAALPPEEQLARAITHGYALFSLLPKDARRTFERMRNGAKKRKSSLRHRDQGA